ncbi:MAG: hypothetical protein RLY20_2668 [Verrucomicrobiota bacterium]|jgi:tetratricopeptide (TPR) repeat protein
MLKLEPHDSHALLAALGWIELGNPREALGELDRAAAQIQDHPAMLDMRWAALVELKDWAAALVVAQKLVEVAPDNVSGWLHRAYALRRVAGGGLPQAWNVLLPAAKQFPQQTLVAFNLACYACQMNRLDEAREWLERARVIEGVDAINQMALADEDLKPLWPEIPKPKAK